METQLEEVERDFTNIQNNWGITVDKLNRDFSNNIQQKIENDLYKDPATEHIKIHDYKVFLKINLETGAYKTGDLLDLSNIVYTKMPELELRINNLNSSYQDSATYNENKSDYTDSKENYEKNKEKYITNKEKIHGALMQAKTQNENYNYLISSTINLICGILILFYLIYKIYSPITIDEIKTAVKTTTETASNVAKQAQSATNKIVSK